MPDEPKPFKLSEDPDFKKMMQTMQGLITLVQTQGTALQAMQRNATVAPQKTADEPEEEEEEDVDSMPQKKFAGFILKQVGSILDEKLGAYGQKLDGALSGIQRKDLEAELKELQKTYKDFDEWNDEMRNLSKDHPTLNIGRLYKLARADNPEKAKQLDDKYADKKDEVKDEGLTLFGGFRPSTRTTGGEGGKDEKQKMTIGDALDKAWDEAVAKVPALGKMEDVLD